MEEYCGALGVRLPSPTRQPKLARACLLLLARLWVGSQPANLIYDLAHEHDISKRTVKSAKERLGVETDRVGWGQGSVVWWRLRGPPFELPSRPPIGCRVDPDLAALNDGWHERMIEAIRDAQGEVQRAFGVKLPDFSKTVAVPTGPNGAFVWLPKAGVTVHAKRLRREARARGERVQPEIKLRDAVGDYPEWHKELFTGPADDLERAEWRAKRRRDADVKAAQRR
jgi:hypothetical protein